MKKEQVQDFKHNWGSLKTHTKQALEETYGLAMYWVEKDLDLVLEKANGMILRLDEWMKKREKAIQKQKPKRKP